MATINVTHDDRDLRRGYRRRRFNEMVVAYIMVAPAAIFTFIFGIYPVILGFWESLQTGRPITDEYVGLDNYTRGTGSLIYVLLFFLCFVFFYLSFNFWRRAREENALHPGDNLWAMLVPGFVVALGAIALTALLVIGGRSQEWFEVIGISVSLVWIPVIVIGIGVAGYAYVRRRYVLHGDFNFYLTNTGLVMVLTTLGVLGIYYTHSQLIDNMQEAREISQLILNNDVGNARPLLPIEDAVLTNVGLEEEVPVQVEINGQVVEAVVSPLAYEQVQATELEGSANVTLRSNQRVMVTLPLERGLGLPPVTYETEGILQIERETGQIGGGAPSIDMSLILKEGAEVLAPFDIYVTGDVGETIVQREGYTIPTERALMGMFVVILAIATTYFMTRTLNQIPEESTSRTKSWLSLGRVVMAIIAIGFVFYSATALIFFRQAADAIDSLTKEQFEVAYQFATGQAAPATLNPDITAAQLMFLPQVSMILTGVFLIGVAFLVWRHASRRETPLGTMGYLFIASALMVGGWMFLSELPAAFTVAGRNAVDVRDALVRTAIFSFGTVPPQLAVGLILAYLLFYEVRVGKGLYRLIYFMPYVTPRVATATIFTVIFSLEASGLANQALTTFGIESQLWLKEPKGVVQVVYEILGGDPQHVPDIFQGPSLAMLTAIVFNVWVYAGYNAVIFLAGLGSIPGELYEAARVDGAGRWAAFRYITLPLLSPVTFFLSILSISGTFRAFNSLFVLRSQAIGQEIDTLSIRIFVELRAANNPGYAASLAFILFGVIIMLTIIQNRIARDRVFYG